ncbi:hypothetical protein [Streptomyces sp. MBT62]|uniref:hypothetical protein n=1 Tax=Streptomyces sp. MBT62 TaxID=2800410 RepID=UPI00190A9F46|nr:hypothetical protein [Streptomyces sp. MBT62]MBK3566493.1 hypothetical protein [Streptomyces sp. MBT62]
MEQRIGSSSQPLEGAGFDPAFVPGLTAPAVSSDAPEDTKPRDAEPEDATAEAAEPEESSADKADVGEAEAEQAAAEDDEADGEEDESDGPVFEASDRRAEIVADGKGVRLRLDDQACEFRWDEIGAVETETPRFGKRFTITVHTPDRRWYPIEIEAAARSRFAEWETQLDAVLDAYFEDGDEDEDDESAEVDEAALAEAEAEVRKD